MFIPPKEANALIHTDLSGGLQYICSLKKKKNPDHLHQRLLSQITIPQENLKKIQDSKTIDQF